MGSGFLSWILGAIVVTELYCMPAAATAEDFCGPSEATDPQPLHINGSKPFIYKTIKGSDLRLHVFSPAGHAPGSRVERFCLGSGLGSHSHLRLVDGPDEVHARAIARTEFGRYRDAAP
jgi:hypothetical protein